MSASLPPPQYWRIPNSCSMTTITLTTDFGLADGYAGIMKGVIHNLVPHATIFDITHSVPPCDVQAADWVIDNAFTYFPTGSVHVAVVDPGVGSNRRAIIIAGQEHCFVGPDNGIFTSV